MKKRIEPPRTPRFAKEYGEGTYHDDTTDTTMGMRGKDSVLNLIFLSVVIVVSSW
jgi:hypothetical protein